jgi:hypothetical protein
VVSNSRSITDSDDHDDPNRLIFGSSTIVEATSIWNPKNHNYGLPLFKPNESAILRHPAASISETVKPSLTWQEKRIRRKFPWIAKGVWWMSTSPDTWRWIRNPVSPG